MKRFSPFGYKIDYDKAIAEDQRQIDLYDSELVRAISAALTEEEVGWMRQGYHVSAFTFLLGAHDTLNEARLAILGVSLDDLGRALFSADIGSQYEVRPQTREEWAAADALRARLEAIPVLEEAHRVKHLKHAKTALSRHRRNQAKG
jgi:hypothetical protein